MKTLLLSALCALLPFCLLADPGDTTIVQTYTFDAQNNPDTNYDSPGRRTFDFPEDDGTTYQKILMYYTLKCFEDGTAGGLGFDCGEWDYTSHTFLYEHTGELDSNALSHPRYLANNSEFDEMAFSNNPLTNTYMYEFMETQIENVIEEEEFSVNNSLGQNMAVAAGIPTRIQFYYTSQELESTGIAGLIQKLSFSLEGESTLSNLNINTSWLTETPADLVINNLENNFNHPLFSFTGGQVDIILDVPIEWDGVSGLLIDFSFDSSEDEFMIVGSEGSSFQSSSADNSYILFNGEDQVSIPPALFESIDEQVTIGYWLYGTSEFQPENNSTFEGVNADNQRVLNCHNPWSNGQVYWDAGQDGGYDRINAQADPDEYEGQWNHWAFSKNISSGEMKIFLNGEEWLNGTNKDNSMAEITKFNIGSSAVGSNYYRGAMDNFFVLDVELTEEEIQTYMSAEYSSSLPQFNNLLGYFGFNHNYGEPVNNEVSELNGLAIGDAALQSYSGADLTFTANEINFKPAISLYVGDYEFSESAIIYQVEENIPPMSVIEYAVDGNELIVLNSQSLYLEGFSYVYGVDGEIIDGMSNAEEEPLNLVNETLNYFSPPFEVVNRIELGRFITPYGIGLDLEEGWTWIYEVTDYEPLLKGEVELEAGNWQELLDLKFAFIEGTPPRDVMRVENIWAGNWQLSTWDDSVQEQDVEVLDGEEMFKVRATTSGHWFGQGNNCAEFCQNIHSLKVNGTTEHSWEMMQECADNPLYPQGGTWIYDRAGWCPGAPVTTRELEISAEASEENFSVEYDIEYDPYGNYWLMGQLITYGGHNFQTDVELSEILAPSDFKLNSRINPICKNPVIRIRNNGSETLNSCTISFGVNGVMETYEWAGELEFMQTEDITLTYSNSEMWEGLEEQLMTFNVEVSLPNGIADPNPSNNITSSTFLRPAIYHYDDYDDNRIIVEVNTNNTPWETAAKLYTIDGNVIWSSNYTQANTLYRDTLVLNSGCYKMHFTDSDDDGLSFFANNDGNGNMRFRKVQGFYFETFEDNFGKELIHHFNFETNLFSGIEEEIIQDFNVYPNPSSGIFHLEGLNLRGNGHCSVVNSSGQEVLNSIHLLKSNSDRIEIDLSSFANGIYSVKLEIDGQVFQKRILKL